MDLDNYYEIIDSIANKYKFTDSGDMFDRGISDDILFDIEPLMEIKSEIMTELDKMGANANYFTFINKNEKYSDSEKMHLKSICLDILILKQEKKFINSFAKYNKNLKIFKDNDLFNYVWENELIDIKCFEIYPTCVEYKNNYISFSQYFDISSLKPYYRYKDKNTSFKTFIRLDPNILFSEPVPLFLQEELITHFDSSWIIKLNIAIGETKHSKFILQNLPDHLIH